MSPGNLYRYFPSKDAIVEGFARATRRSWRKCFAVSLADERHRRRWRRACADACRGAAREDSQMILEIWAEAGRNPAIAAICATSTRMSRTA